MCMLVRCLQIVLLTFGICIYITHIPVTEDSSLYIIRMTCNQRSEHSQVRSLRFWEQNVTCNNVTPYLSLAYWIVEYLANGIKKLLSSFKHKFLLLRLGIVPWYNRSTIAPYIHDIQWSIWSHFTVAILGGASPFSDLGYVRLLLESFYYICANLNRCGCEPINRFSGTRKKSTCSVQAKRVNEGH